MKIEDLTREEVVTDLENTKRDVKSLQAIVDNLETFVFQSGGENRTAHKVYLSLYQGLLREGIMLQQKIEEVLAKL